MENWGNFLRNNSHYNSQLISLHSLKNNLYIPFYEQQLINTGYIAILCTSGLMGNTPPLYNFDGFISIFSIWYETEKTISNTYSL